jgi:TIR domain
MVDISVTDTSSRTKHDPPTVLQAASAPSIRISGKLGPQTRIFINYRRQDTAPAAAHLHASLARRFGAQKVFRDLVTIEPGQDFSAVIDQAIGATSVFIALIGRRWLTLKGRDGKRRLDDPKDLLRLEIESALRLGTPVIPVLVDGATMPTREELPASIADLAACNAYELPWHEEVARLGRRIAKIERERDERDATERAERERLDLTRGARVMPSAWRSQKATASFNVVIGAMEMSLAYQGQRVSLSSSDLWASMEKITGRQMDQGFVFADLVYVIDIVGVKAKRSEHRYIARSYPLTSLQDLPKQIEHGRPVLAGVRVFESWWREPSSKTGFIDLAEPGDLQGAIVGAIVAWDPAKEELKLLTPWPTWGAHGTATLTRAAAERSLDPSNLRSIEVVQMPRPFTALAIESASKSSQALPKKKPRRGRV